MKRKELREAAVKLFYEMDIQKTLNISFIKNLAENELIALKDNYLKEVFDNFLLNRDNIDDIIQKSSTSWDIKRIAKVDLSILRVAITEILYLSDIPDKVSINEAIDLAKKYGDAELPSRPGANAKRQPCGDNQRRAGREEVERIALLAEAAFA